MLRVALTGGVGSGKSTAAAMLQGLGARLSQSDEVARSMMQPGQPVFRAIEAHFGQGVLSADGGLDRKKLAYVAFEQGRLHELEDLIHPAVIAEQARWMDAVGAGEPSAVAVIESALVFETRHTAPVDLAHSEAAPWRTRFDRIIVVTAPLDVRRDRYIARSRADAEEAAADFHRRSAAQWSDERRAEHADFVVPNAGSLEELHDRIRHLYLELRQEAEDAAQEAM